MIADADRRKLVAIDELPSPQRLVVSPLDPYVSARSGPPRAELAAYIESIPTFAALIPAVKLLFPSATQIDELDWTGPQRLMREMIGPELVAAVAGRFGLDEHEAIGKIVRDCAALCPDALAPLRATPPETIHAMERGPYWIGNVYTAGLVTAALASVGANLEGRLLDWGCSSGGVARVLAVCFPALQVTGTDPVAASIAWARDNLKLGNLTFRDQTQQPPLPFDDATFDIVAGISVFSHHGPGAARKWFAELARVLKPGGHLVFSAHGAGAVVRHARHAELPFEQLKAVLLELAANGHAFLQPWAGADETGNLTDLEWGCSYYLPATIVALMHPALEPRFFASRANQANQDIYVARRPCWPRS